MVDDLGDAPARKEMWYCPWLGKENEFTISNDMLKNGEIPKMLAHYFGNSALYAGELERATKEFFDESVLPPSEELTQGLFSEWFLHVFRLKNGDRVIDDFCARNPLRLSREDLKVYEALRQSVYGLFEVIDVERNVGLRIEGITTRRSFFVHEKLGTHDVKPGHTIFARVAHIGDHDELVGANSPVLPIQMASSVREYWREVRESDPLTPKHAAILLAGIDRRNRRW